MRIFIFILLTMNLYSCREATKVNPIIEDETEKDANTQKNVVDPITQIDWSNPVLIGGASFGNIININYKLGEFNELYRLTNSALKSSLTKEEIINRYRSLPLGFDLHRGALSHPRGKARSLHIRWQAQLPGPWSGCASGCHEAFVSWSSGGPA